MCINTAARTQLAASIGKSGRASSSAVEFLSFVKSDFAVFDSFSASVLRICSISKWMITKVSTLLDFGLVNYDHIGS